MAQTRLCGRRPLVRAQHLAVPLAAPYLANVAATGNDIDWSRGMPEDDWGEAMNDQLSCCTVSGAVHAIYTWGSYRPPNPTYTDPQVVEAYASSAGYVPGVAVTDRGNTCIAMLEWWRKNTFFGEPLEGYYRLDPSNIADLRLAVEIAGVVYLGIGLTEDQINNTPAPWDFTGTPGNNGHCVLVNAHDNVSGGLKCVTWGMPGQVMTPAFLANCCDEAYVLASSRWLSGGRTPEGFSATAFLNDVQTMEIPA